MKNRKSVFAMILSLILASGMVLPNLAAEVPGDNTPPETEKVTDFLQETETVDDEIADVPDESEEDIHKEAEGAEEAGAVFEEDASDDERKGTAEIEVERKAGSSDVDSSGTSRWLSDYDYTVKDGELTLTKYMGTASEVTVPGSAYVNNVLFGRVFLTRQMWGNTVTSLAFEKGVTLPADSSYMFGGDFFTESPLISFDGTNLDTTLATDMQWMFANCSNLTELDVSKFDTSSVTNMDGMFWYCSNLTELDVSHFDTSLVTDMTIMFNGCKNLPELDVSHFDTSSVTNMNGMFADCSNLPELDVSHFDTTLVTDMSWMFSECVKLPELDVSQFDTSSVTNMKGMFSFCYNLTELDVSQFGTSLVTDMSEMFYYCSNLPELDVSRFDTSLVTNMSHMFANCDSLTELDLSSFDMTSAEEAEKMLDFTPKAEKVKIHTPRNVVLEIDLPSVTKVYDGDGNLIAEDGAFYDQDGNIHTKLPMNRSSGMLLVKNGKVSFLGQPEDAEAETGKELSISADFDGHFEYGIWQYKGVEDNGWTEYRRGTEKKDLQELTIQAAPEWNGRSVRLVLYDAWGRALSSREAVITVRDYREKRSKRSVTVFRTPGTVSAIRKTIIFLCLLIRSSTETIPERKRSMQLIQGTAGAVTVQACLLQQPSLRQQGAACPLIHLRPAFYFQKIFLWEIPAAVFP